MVYLKYFTVPYLLLGSIVYKKDEHNHSALIREKRENEHSHWRDFIFFMHTFFCPVDKWVMRRKAERQKRGRGQP
jgi:hypothetical protein